jgi:hypothetical protein
MKTSKIIFISILGSIAFIILAAFADVRINGHRRGSNLPPVQVSRQSIPSFKVLCVSNTSNVIVIRSDSSFIDLTWHKDSLAPGLNYKIKNDTLLFSDFNRSEQSSSSVKIYSTRSLEYVYVKDSDIRIHGDGTGKIFLNVDKSYIWFDLDINKISTFQKLYVRAKNHSDINTGHFSVDSLEFDLNNSEAQLELNTGTVCGTLSDSSNVYLWQPEEISIKRDTTSEIILIR